MKFFAAVTIATAALAVNASAGTLTVLTNGQQLNVTQLQTLCAGSTGSPGNNVCQLGDKDFSNFLGNIDSGALIQFGFIGNVYTVQYTDNNAGGFVAPFVESFHIAVDVPLQPGPNTYISQVAAGLNDANNNAIATFSKALSNGASGTATCTENAGTQHCTPVGTNPGTLSMDVTDTYTVSLNGNSVIALSNSFNQTTPSGVPEPVSMLLFGSGLLAISLVGRKKFARK